MTNENPAGKESTGNDRDAQSETESETTELNSVETTEVNGEQMVPLSEVEQVVEKTVAERLDEELDNLIDIRSDSETPAVEDIWIAGQPFGKIVNGNRETAKSAEKQARVAGSSNSESTGNDGENGSDDGLLPIERLLRGEDEDWYAGMATESVDRAKELFRHFEDWSSKTPKGRVIKTSGGKRGTFSLKDLLNAVLDEPTISWKQVYRACEKLDEWTKGAIEFIDHGRHGKILVMNGDGPSSSVAKG
jgi:hypothetical protein